MKKGKLQSWKNSYGFVAVSFTENYFLHRSGIVEIPEGLISPPLGAEVVFDVAPPRKKGGCPMAVNARVLADSEGGVA